MRTETKHQIERAVRVGLGTGFLLAGTLPIPNLIFAKGILEGEGASLALAFFGLLVASGVALMRSALVKPKGQRPPLDDAQILAAARRRDGRITATELALDLGLGATVAQDALDALVIRGVAGIDVGKTGLMIYRFTKAREEAPEIAPRRRRGQTESR